jgi:hypothetical protein
MDQNYIAFESLIRMNLPADSKVTSVNLIEIRKSLYVKVNFEVSAEYQKKYDLMYKKRSMNIRLLKAEGDEGLPVDSGADRTDEFPSEPLWLKWDDLTETEQEQARDSYIEFRRMEAEDETLEVDSDNVMDCRFERMKDGYIYVDL